MSDTLTILSIVLTAIFGFSGFFFYYKSKRLALPTFVIARTFLQTKAHPEVVILFNQKKVENLAGARILFFNSGTKEIRSEDIPNGSYPIVEFTPPSQILSHSLLASSCKEINLKVDRLTDTTLQINFDYLNPFDGGLFEVLYEVPQKSQTFPFTLKAKIIGSHKVVSRSYFRQLPIKIRILSVLLSMFFFIGGILVIIFPKSGKEILSWFAGTILMAFSIFLFVSLLDSIRAGRIPTFAKEFFE